MRARTNNKMQTYADTLDSLIKLKISLFEKMCEFAATSSLYRFKRFLQIKCVREDLNEFEVYSMFH